MKRIVFIITCMYFVSCNNNNSIESFRYKKIVDSLKYQKTIDSLKLELNKKDAIIDGMVNKYECTDHPMAKFNQLV